MPLSEAAIADLARSGLTAEHAIAADWQSIPDAHALHDSFRAAPALVIPYFDAGGALVLSVDRRPYYRLRYLEMPVTHTFIKAKPVRYVQEPHTLPHLYLAPMADRDYWHRVFADPAVPLLITEGEKKALLTSLYGHACVGLGGVDSIRVPEWAACNWKDRRCYIVFDSDALFNANVRAAEARLAQWLLDRGARVYICRIPPNDDGSKVGLDDYIVAGGDIDQLVHEADKMSAIDADIVAKINSQVCWVESAAKLYEPASNGFIDRDVFVTGSKYSHMKVPGAHEGAAPKKPGGKKAKIIMTEQSLARVWLTHPLKRLYQDRIFMPGGPEEFETMGGRALNIWHGWVAEEGDVEPFLAFNEYLMGRLEPQYRDLALKMMAYKAQHPQYKIPVAPVLVGTPNSGKSLWGQCIAEAFSPYAYPASPGNFKANFNGWIENSVIVTVEEMGAAEFRESYEKIKTLITDPSQSMERKFHDQKKVQSYAQYIFDTNRHGAAAFDRHERRMFIIECPDPPGTAGSPQSPPDAAAAYAWKNAGGGKALMHYLLTLDLKEFNVPIVAPMTAEKRRQQMQNRSPIVTIAEALMDPNRPKNYLALAWRTAAGFNTAFSTAADKNKAELAEASGKFLAANRPRPLMTPQEFLWTFPMIHEYLSGRKFKHNTTGGQIANELQQAGIPLLDNADNSGVFYYFGNQEMIVVLDDFERFANKKFTQAEFEAIMAEYSR